MVMRGGLLFKKEYLLPFCLVLAVGIYVILPLINKEYKPDPALAGILTGLIGILAGSGSGTNKKKDKNKTTEPEDEDA